MWRTAICCRSQMLNKLLNIVGLKKLSAWHCTVCCGVVASIHTCKSQRLVTEVYELRGVLLQLMS
jgi:hypothetical protein